MIAGLGRDLRTRRFWRSFALHAFAFGGFVAALLQVYDLFQPDAISESALPLPLVVAALAIAYAVARSWPRPVEQQYSRPSTQIRVVVGDLFDQDANLVIGMATTFDTAVPHVISKRSVQGQFLERIYSSDTAALDAALAEALAATEPTGSVEKDGKSATYPVGTIAVIRQNRKHYFCAAYTEMDEQNVAHGSVPGVWRSLENLWDEVRARSNGDPIAMPVIGGGQARMSHVLPAQDSIRLIALSFILASRDSRVCERLDIVVREGDVPALDMLELQAFLTSLQES
ncbi:MAG: DUF6430 domain-containing protein [Acidimicrobiales bacterium]|nr:DUF6430 domain-containing protein [Acidimicrobiales bacterium]